ncbi:MAG: hypothetical protein LBU12_07615 [Deltaproteobacteria bacterium]|jgi:hypothetical protein|nr:hypothetical protein [Deltaproteobacteria bacterium]
MLFKRKNPLLAKVQAAERTLAAHPLAAAEVDLETALHMGAFVEDAVDLDDFYHLEPGVLDDWLPPGGSAHG